MSEKTYASIYIDRTVIRKAKDLGLNISKTCENALKEAIKRLEGSNSQSNCNNLSGEGCVKQVEPGKGFEPLYSESAARRLNRSATPAL